MVGSNDEFRVSIPFNPDIHRRILREIETANRIAVDFKNLPGELLTAAQFLKEHMKGRVKTRGNEIQLDEARHKEVRLLLHKYLHHRGIMGYRVLSQSGTFSIAPLHLATPSRPETGAPPSASSTLPYLFPNTPVLAPKEKKPPARKKQRATRKKT